MGSIDWIKDNGQEITINDRPENIKYCESLGWKRKISEETIPNVDGDKGSGIPGTLQWHKSAILGMDSKEEIIAYLESLSLSVHNGGLLETIREKAIKAVEGINYGNSP